MRPNKANSQTHCSRLYTVFHISGTPVANAIFVKNFIQLFWFFTQAFYYQFATMTPNLSNIYLSSQITVYKLDKIDQIKSYGNTRESKFCRKNLDKSQLYKDFLNCQAEFECTSSVGSEFQDAQTRELTKMLPSINTVMFSINFHVMTSCSK